jgi:hypothetical protein
MTIGQTAAEQADALELKLSNELDVIVAKSALYNMADGKLGPSWVGPEPPASGATRCLMGDDPRLPALRDNGNVAEIPDAEHAANIEELAARLSAGEAGKIVAFLRSIGELDSADEFTRSFADARRRLGLPPANGAMNALPSDIDTRWGPAWGRPGFGRRRRRSIEHSSSFSANASSCARCDRRDGVRLPNGCHPWQPLTYSRDPWRSESLCSQAFCER